MRFKYVSIKLKDGETQRRQTSVSFLGIMVLMCLKKDKRCKGWGRKRKEEEKNREWGGREGTEGEGREEGRETGKRGREEEENSCFMACRI